MLLSIIVPIYNTDIDLLDKCVKSILRQSGCDIELILVDDCSSDKRIAEKLKEYEQEKGVGIYRTAENGGPGRARNVGLGKAKGELIAFVDADDSLVENTFRGALEYMSENDYDTVVFEYIKYSNFALE